MFSFQVVLVLISDLEKSILLNWKKGSYSSEIVLFILFSQVSFCFAVEDSFASSVYSFGLFSALFFWISILVHLSIP